MSSRKRRLLWVAVVGLALVATSGCGNIDSLIAKARTFAGTDAGEGSEYIVDADDNYVTVAKQYGDSDGTRELTGFGLPAAGYFDLDSSNVVSICEGDLVFSLSEIAAGPRHTPMPAAADRVALGMDTKAATMTGLEGQLTGVRMCNTSDNC